MTLIELQTERWREARRVEARAAIKMETELRRAIRWMEQRRRTERRGGHRQRETEGKAGEAANEDGEGDLRPRLKVASKTQRVRTEIGGWAPKMMRIVGRPRVPNLEGPICNYLNALWRIWNVIQKYHFLYNKEFILSELMKTPQSPTSSWIQVSQYTNHMCGWTHQALCI